MGIESISGMTGAASYQAQATPAVKPASKSEAGNTDVSTSAEIQSAATSQPVVIKQVEAGEQGGKADANTQNPSQEADLTKKLQEQKLQEQAQDQAAMKSAAKDINKLINRNTVAEFGYHEATHRITIKIKDKDTDEVIKEIPSEKALKMLQKAWEIAGILVDEKR